MDDRTWTEIDINAQTMLRDTEYRKMGWSMIADALNGHGT